MNDILKNIQEENETEEPEEVEEVVQPSTITEPQASESKEFIQIELPTFKITLGSCVRPVEQLCDLVLLMKEKLNGGDSKNQPGYC
jgi:hypothetical protein